MIEWLEFESKSLHGFPMGDPTHRRFPVYLPPGYDSRRKEPYPVAFLLAGWGSKSSSYLADDSAFGLSLERRLDQMIEEGKLPGCLIAFPDATSKLGGSQYLNSPAFGHYSDYLCDELVDLIDSRFHTHRSADFRAIMGHSSGGFGALINAVLRPDRFRYVCSSAGDSFFELCLMPLIRFAVEEIEKSKGVENFVRDFLDFPSPKSLPRAKGESLMLLSMAACYAPNPKAPPLYGDLFFDLETGAILPEVWSKYLAWDPIHFFPKHEKNAKQLRYILLECGKSDEYGLQFGHRQLAQVLKKMQIPMEIVETPGGHSGQGWRWGERLQKLLSKM